MTEREKMAVESVRKSISGKPAGGLAANLAGDVVIVAGLSTKPADTVVDGLRVGASAVSPETEIFQTVWQVSHLIGSLPANGDAV